jgi:glycosyltransferase involved in cell wall biosynthesis
MKTIVLFYNLLNEDYGGMEMHGNHFIEYYSKSKNFNFKGIISKGTDNKNYLICNEKVKEINLTNQSLDVDIIFFNSGHWIEELEGLKQLNSKTKFIYRTGGNEILKASLSIENIQSHTIRQQKWVTILNNTINFLITNSNYTEKRLSLLGIKSLMLKRNVGGVNVDFIRKLKKKHTYIQRDVVQFVCAARFVHYKNHRKLLHAFNELDKKGIDFKVILIGDGNLQEEMKNFVKSNNLTHKIVFHNKKSNEEVLESILSSDYYIQFSSEYVRKVKGGNYIHAEGMGRTILEAICSGTYVITTKTGAVPEIINSENGLLLDIENEEKIILSLEQLILERPKSIEQDYSHYSWSHYFKRYDKLFKTL